MNSLRNEYSSKINILKGVELGLTSDNFSLCHKLLDSYDFDFVIGSCHIVDNMDPYYSEFWENRNEADAFRTYFSTLLDALKLFNSFNTLGHLDYIVRYAPNKDKNYNCSDYFNIVEQIFKEIIHKNIALEINTGALAKGMDFVNPHFDMLSFYKIIYSTRTTNVVAAQIMCGETEKMLLETKNLFLCITSSSKNICKRH